jgi:hypothetical protein
VAFSLTSLHPNQKEKKNEQEESPQGNASKPRQTTLLSGRVKALILTV